MHAVIYRVGRWLWSSAGRVALTMVVVGGLVASVPMALAAGAQRTATAPDRYVASFDGAADLVASQESGPALTTEVAALPAVAAVESVTFVVGGLVADGEMLEGIVFSGSPVAAVGPGIVAGRAPDPGRAGEFVLTGGLAEAKGLAIGDRVDLHTFTPEQFATDGFDPNVSPEGPTVESVLVGLVEVPPHATDRSERAVFSAALLDDPRIATAGSVLAIVLADGASTEQFRAQLDTIPGGGALALDPDGFVDGDVRSAVRGQALGLWLLAGLAAALTVLALAYLIGRMVRVPADEVQALSSLGATRGGVVAETVIRSGIVVALAILLAVVFAGASSGMFPFGFVESLEPDPGPRLAPFVLAAGAVILGLAIVGVITLGTALRRSPSPAHQPDSVDAIARRCPSGAMSTGVRFAFTSRDSASLAARIAVSAISVAVLAGTVTFAVSVRRLVVQPSHYGANFDFAMDSGSDVIPGDLLTLLDSDPDIADVTLFTATQAQVDGTGEPVPIAGAEPRRGTLVPVLLSGRLPTGADEVAFGRVSARRAGASIGDRVSLSAVTSGASAEYEVTGLVVPPGIRGNDRLGEGAVVTSAGFARLEPGRAPHTALGRLRPDAPADARTRLLALIGADEDDVALLRPPAIVSVARITYVPFVLATLVALLTLLTVVSAAYTAVRRRAHEVGVLRALGADGPFLAGATRWQALASILVPIVIGVPAGLLAGRTAFRVYADDLGAFNRAAIPAGALGLGAAVLVGAVLVAAAIAARQARQVMPASLLRAE